MTEANKATVCVYLQDNQSPAEKRFSLNLMINMLSRTKTSNGDILLDATVNHIAEFLIFTKGTKLLNVLLTASVDTICDIMSICKQLDALRRRADSDHRAYMPCHRRDGAIGTPELINRCYSLRAAPLSVTTTSRAEQLEDGPRRRRRRRRDPRYSQESAAGRMEKLRTWAGATPRQRTGGPRDLAETGLTC
jgi:hypothetical protein